MIKTSLPTLLAVGIFSLVLVGCSPSTADQLEHLKAEIADGENCSDLFATFDDIDEQSDVFDDARGEMVAVGCYSRTSERHDGGTADSLPISDGNSQWFDVHGAYVETSPQCDTAAQTAAAETDSTAAEPLIAATLDACESVDEWMSALKDHPGILGLVDGYIPVVFDVQSVCYSYPNTAVCTDAAQLGIELG